MIPGFCEQVTDVCAAPNGPAQFTIASRDGRMGIVDVERLNAHLNAMAASPDHARLVISLVSGEVEVYHSNNGLLIKRQRVAAMPISQVACSAGNNIITLGGSASQSLAVSRTLSFFHPRDLTPTGNFHGITADAGHLPLSVNHSSGHLLTQQSPPKLWHFPDQTLATLLPGSDEGWSCHFLTETELLARGESGLRTPLEVSNSRKPMGMPAPFAKNDAILDPQNGRVLTSLDHDKCQVPSASALLVSSRRWCMTLPINRPLLARKRQTVR